jgi:hypothetical protein
MVGLGRFQRHTFRALAKTFSTMWVRCDVWRQCARLNTRRLARCGLPDEDDLTLATAAYRLTYVW